MAQLGVGHKHAIHDDGGADAGAEGGHEDQALAALGGAVLRLADTCGIRVIDDDNGATGAFLQQRMNVNAHPRLVEVRHVIERLARLDGSGERNANRNAVRHIKMIKNLLDDVGHCFRSGDFRSGDAQAFVRELALLEIHRCTLDARSANVDAECLCAFNHDASQYCSDVAAMASNIQWKTHWQCSLSGLVNSSQPFLHCTASSGLTHRRHPIPKAAPRAIKGLTP